MTKVHFTILVVHFVSLFKFLIHKKDEKDKYSFKGFHSVIFMTLIIRHQV